MIVECVPNFSEGRDRRIISAICEAAGRALLNACADADHNRSVLTLAGRPEAVVEAVLAAARVAVELIDLGTHTGVHPRLGAVDVVPFVPVEDISLAECAELARAVGESLWSELGVPVYLYEAAGARPLEEVRRVASRVPPDIGTGRHPTAGATAVGARTFLVAWNINLATSDLRIAREVAREIRHSSGGLPAVKALGFPLASKRQVQVSINLVDFEVTPLHVIFDSVARACKLRGVHIVGSELIGMIPAAALDASMGHDLHWLNLTPDLILGKLTQ